MNYHKCSQSVIELHGGSYVKPKERYRDGMGWCERCASGFHGMVRCPCCRVKLRFNIHTQKWRREVARIK